MTASTYLDEVGRVTSRWISAARALGSRRVDPEGGRPRAPSKRRAMVTLAVALAMLGFVLRVYAPGTMTETYDEPAWLQRSDYFRTALATHHFAEASAAYHPAGIQRDDTMPGVTTMWAGTIGRGIAVVTGHLGLSAKVVGPSKSNADVLRASRAVVALWCSIALGLFVYLAWLLVGRGAAGVAGVVLATEPWLVGHSDLLHTDAMVTMFSAVSMLALAVGLGMSRLERRGRRRLVIRRGWVIASGTFAALGVLTKLNAVVLLFPGAVILAAASWSRQNRSTDGQSWRGALRARHIEQLATTLALWLAIGIAVFVALWPAMWVAPLGQLTAMRHALRQVGGGQHQFFLGHVSNNPGPAYYWVAFFFRATPWLVAGTVAAIGLAVAKLVHRIRPRPLGVVMRYLDGVPLWPLAVCVPYLATISWSPKKFDRYLLPVFPFLALVTGAIVSAALVAIADSHWSHGPADRYWSHNLIAVTSLAVAIGLSVITVVQAPYAISYADPLVGGQHTASHAIMLGWNEGIEQLGATIARQHDGRCDSTVVGISVSPVSVALPCGQLVGVPDDPDVDLARYDYVVSYINIRQRGKDAAVVPRLRRDAVLIDRATIGGVSYAELWRVRKVAANVTPVANVKPAAH